MFETIDSNISHDLSFDIQHEPFIEMSNDAISLDSEFELENNLEFSTDLNLNISSVNKNNPQELLMNLNTSSSDHKENQTKKQLTKEDLLTIPLPIFTCIYCANEKISFGHLINEILSSKYLFNSSKYSTDIITKLVENKNINEENSDKLINKLKYIILNNTEHLYKYYSKDCSKDMLNKIINKNHTELLYNKKEQLIIESDTNKNLNLLNIDNDKIFKNDLKKKINKNLIDFENEPYDIWNCDDLSDICEQESNSNKEENEDKDVFLHTSFENDSTKISLNLSKSNIMNCYSAKNNKNFSKCKNKYNANIYELIIKICLLILLILTLILKIYKFAK